MTDLEVWQTYQRNFRIAFSYIEKKYAIPRIVAGIITLEKKDIFQLDNLPQYKFSNLVKSYSQSYLVPSGQINFV